MNNKLIGHTFFNKKPKVGKYQLQAINAGRMAILEDKKNPLALGEAGVASPWAVHEAFFVAWQGSSELLTYSLEPDDEWERRVREFALDLADDDLNEFWEIFQAEVDEINKSKVVEAPKAVGKRVSRGGKTKR